MYAFLLILHSLFRWLVLFSLLYSVYRAFSGWRNARQFGKTDDRTRHITATIAHVQLAIGYVLYFQSPLVAFFRSNYKQAVQQFEFLFFGMIHIGLMTTAVVLLSIGSSLAKRKAGDAEKFRTMLIWFVLALLIIFLAIPWPFSPLASRPFLRY